VVNSDSKIKNKLVGSLDSSRWLSNEDGGWGDSAKTALGMLIIIFLTAVLLALLFIPSFLAIPNDLTINGRLTNSAGTSLAGTNAINFSIYDNSTGGNTLYSSNQSVTTDSNGVFSVRLTGVTLNFTSSYYLGIKVGTDSEMTPRINLSSAPYAYRSQNISVEGVAFTSSVNIGNNNFTINGTTFFVDVANARVGIGTTTPSNLLDVRGVGNFSGTVYVNNATNVLTSLSKWATNGTNLYNSTVLFVGIGTSTPTAKLEISKSGNGNVSLNVSGTLFVNDSSVGIGTTGPSTRLHIFNTDPSSGGIILDGSASPGIQFYKNGTANHGFLGMAINAGNFGADTQSNDSSFGAQQGGRIHFATHSAGGNPITRMIVTNAGNVGIGTTSPKARLDVSNSTLGITFNPIGGGADGNSPYINTTANNLTIRSTGGSVIIRLG